MCFLMGHYLSELLPTENHILPQIHNDCGPSLISGLGAFRKDFDGRAVWRLSWISAELQSGPHGLMWFVGKAVQGC